MRISQSCDIQTTVEVSFALPYWTQLSKLGELVYYFSHHEKLCVIDNKVAAMGGLDACYGRWDTRDHPLADVHPTEFYKSLFPGQGRKHLKNWDFG